MPSVLPPSPLRRLRAWPPARRAAALYRRHERYTPVLFFFGGGLWDALTLKRIDAAVDNALLMAYLVAGGALIAAAALVEAGRAERAWLLRLRPYLPSAVQFVLGALFSAHVVYYFQSTSLTSSAVFFVLLVALLVGNEFAHSRAFNLYVVVGLYFLAAASFFIFFVPVVLKTMAYGAFLAGVVLGGGLAWALVRLLLRWAVLDRWQARRAAGLVLAGAALLNGFYLMNWIPPVPLAMRHGAVYRDVRPFVDGAFELGYTPPPWYRFWEEGESVFAYTPGDTAYCFTAVFAPTALEQGIVHVWRFRDEATGAWVETDRRTHRITGGRDGGYRTYTAKRHLRPAPWRVDVETTDGRTLGRVRFRVVPAEAPVAPRRYVRYE